VPLQTPWQFDKNTVPLLQQSVLSITATADTFGVVDVSIEGHLVKVYCHMSNNSPLWFNIAAQISTLEARKDLLNSKKEAIEEEIKEVNQSIALLKLVSNPIQPVTPSTRAAATQTDLHLPKSHQLMFTPLTELQQEEEERKSRIVKSFKKK
jgi:hypothetical protein